MHRGGTGASPRTRRKPTTFIFVPTGVPPHTRAHSPLRNLPLRQYIIASIMRVRVNVTCTRARGVSRLVDGPNKRRFFSIFFLSTTAYRCCLPHGISSRSHPMPDRPGKIEKRPERLPSKSERVGFLSGRARSENN